MPLFSKPIRRPCAAGCCICARLIFAAAADLPGTGGLVETLKWGQPAYLTVKPKTGSTIRIDAFGGRDEHYAMFVHCQSRLVESFRVLYPQTFTFEGKRALLFGLRG